MRGRSSIDQGESENKRGTESVARWDSRSINPHPPQPALTVMNVDLLSQNPVYANLEPIDVVEAEGALVPIMYSPDCQYSPFSSPTSCPTPPPPSAGQSLILTTFWSRRCTDKEAMGYFRALSAKQEYSERVLDVTLRVIRLNPAHYTVWCVLFTLLVQTLGGLTYLLGLCWILSGSIGSRR